MVLTIDLLKRFGGSTADITKARKGKPDSGMDYRAWNKANPKHNPKGADGRWRGAGAMVSELLDVLQRHHGSGPDLFVAKLTEQVERAAHEAGLRSATRRGDLVRFDPDVHQISGRKPKPGTMVEVERPGFDVPEWRMEGLEEADTGKLRLINVVPARVKRSGTAAEHDFDAKKPRTPKVTAKPERDYEQMAAEIRALPVLPESEAEARRMLEPLTIPELKAFAGSAGVPVTSRMRKQELRDTIHNQLYGTRAVTDSVMNYDDPGRFDRRRAEARERAAAISGDPDIWGKLRQEHAKEDAAGTRAGTPIGPAVRQAVSDAITRRGIRPDPDGMLVHVSDIRNELGDRFSRAEVDDELRRLSNERNSGFLLVPQSNRKILTDEQRAGAVRIGGEDREMLSVHPSGLSQPGDASPKADAKRRRLAELEEAAATSGNTRESIRLRDQADELRREIADDDATGKVDQPPEVTRAEVMEVYSRLAAKPGALVSLVKIRGHLPHLRHGELTAVLKQMDRERIIQLDPDPNRKALPPEAHEAAIVIGGEPKHFISVIGGGGKA